MPSILALFPILLAIFTQQTLGNKVTFTVDPELVEEDALFDCLKIMQNNALVNYEPTMISSVNPIQFSVDWNKFPQKNEKAEDLQHIGIYVYFKYGPQHQYNYYREIELWQYSFSLHRHLFVGGKANLIPSERVHYKLVYVEDPHGQSFAPPGVLTFNVAYLDRMVASVRDIAITHTSEKVEMDECAPHKVDGKFTLDLAACNVVNDVDDFHDLTFAIHFTLKIDNPRRPEWVKRSVPLDNVEEALRRQLYAGGQMNFVFNDDKDAFEITYGDPNKPCNFHINKPEIVSEKSSHHHGYALATSSSGHSHDHGTASSSSNRQQSPPQKTVNSNKITEIELFIDHINKKVVEREGEFWWGEEKRKLFDEGKNMKLSKKDGPECPLRVRDNFQWHNSTAFFLIHWSECTQRIGSAEELDGMVLNFAYQNDDGPAIELRYTLTKSDPLKRIFDGNMRFRLEADKDGNVKHFSGSLFNRKEG